MSMFCFVLPSQVGPSTVFVESLKVLYNVLCSMVEAMQSYHAYRMNRNTLLIGFLCALRKREGERRGVAD